MIARTHTHTHTHTHKVLGLKIIEITFTLLETANPLTAHRVLGILIDLFFFSLFCLCCLCHQCYFTNTQKAFLSKKTQKYDNILEEGDLKC